MDFSILFGIFFAGAAIYYGAPDVRADITVYLQLESLILVLGGTIASTLISTSFKDMQGVLKAFIGLLTGKQGLKPKDSVEIMIKVSELAQTGNKQALLDETKGKGDGFLYQAINMMASGLDKEFIDRALETSIFEIGRRHSKMIGVVRNMGSFAPMFGMAGTVIGVTQVLKNVTDIDNIVSGMALALLTTLYGLFLSSVLFIPLANKLKNKSDKERLSKEIMREGMTMVMDKEIPLKVKEYLSAYLDRAARSGQTEEE